MKCERCGKETLDVRMLDEEIICEQCYNEDEDYGRKALKKTKRQKKKKGKKK